jgi:hypothetical protein
MQKKLKAVEINWVFKNEFVLKIIGETGLK